MKIHFIGIGGIGMSALGDICLESGYEVSGSDLKANERTEALQSRGAKFYAGHQASNIPAGCSTVVFSNAVKPDNPEIREALKNGVSLLSRGAFLTQLFEIKETFGVVGSHGKTTTTSFAASALMSLDDTVSYYIGGILKQTGRNGHWGEGALAVIELDESDSSFLSFRKGKGALITNIEWEHVDYYPSEKDYKDAFAEFARSFSGPLFIGESAFESLKTEMTKGEDVLTVGLSKGDCRPEKWGNDFFIAHGHRCNLKKQGAHMVFDAFLVYTALTETGCDKTAVILGLEAYEGTGRRMELLASVKGISLYDDYGHHPGEIEAVLKSFGRDMQTMVLFQPHRYSRFERFYKRFVDLFSSYGDYIIVLPVYAASEQMTGGPQSPAFVHELEQTRGNVFYAGCPEEAYHLMKAYLSSPMRLISFGAGDGNAVVKRLAAELREGSWPI